MADVVEQPAGKATGWERRLEWIFEAAPYLLLSGASLLTLLQVNQSWAHRLTTLGLAALTAAWILVTYTLRSERWRQHTGAMLLYFAGMLTMAWVLQARSFFFVAFTIVGFLQPFMFISAAPLGFLVVAATSVVVYTASGGFPKPTVEAWSGYLFIVALQTLLTGFFSFVGAKLSKEHKQRQQLVADLEAALEENAGLHAQLLAQAREAGVLDERARMAREIHDTLAQGLTGIITQLEAAERARHLPEQLSRHMDQARSLARESLTEGRRSVDDEVLLDVRDDGVGFDVGSLDGSATGGFGLRGMRQRLRRVAGNLEIESAPGEGTAINASVPAIPAEGGG
jgi:signal transduction histidine kinase